MSGLEWVEVDSSDGYELQVNLVAYNGMLVLGSIVYHGGCTCWKSVIEGNVYCLRANSLEEAKRELFDDLDKFCEDKIEYYKDTQESLDYFQSGSED